VVTPSAAGSTALSRLREWDIKQAFGYPGDGINGLLAAWGSRDEHHLPSPGLPQYLDPTRPGLVEDLNQGHYLQIWGRSGLARVVEECFNVSRELGMVLEEESVR
jgi:hypothetical protein